MVASRDAGITWGAPVRFARRCSLQGGDNLSGSQVVVGRHGEVYVAYASIKDGGLDAQILFRRSDDGGMTFGSETVVGTPIPAANPFSPQLQGFFRTNPFPMLAVDKSGSPHSGNLYMVWTDASQNVIDDLLIDFFNGDSNCVAAAAVDMPSATSFSAAPLMAETHGRRQRWSVRLRPTFRAQAATSSWPVSRSINSGTSPSVIPTAVTIRIIFSSITSARYPRTREPRLAIFAKHPLAGSQTPAPMASSTRCTWAITMPSVLTQPGPMPDSLALFRFKTTEIPMCLDLEFPRKNGKSCCLVKTPA